MSALTVEVLESLGDVEPQAWDTLTGDDDPFVEFGFLRGLEVTGCVGDPDSGWVPRHLLVRSGSDILEAMPLYEKHDSYGEYIFDWGWARAAQLAGLPYYPKIVSAVPFTPVTGRRLLLHPELDDAGRGRITAALFEGVRAVAAACDASSAHLLFVTEAEQAEASGFDFLPRASYQFHWESGGWETFDDYLAALRAPARKQIRRERRRAHEHDLPITMKRGPELTDRDWDGLWTFYRHTTGRKWGRPYLNRAFFDWLRGNFSHRVVAAFAYDGDEPVAGSLFFAKGAHLYGRYWGTMRRLDAMHFELCYYQAIEWCIRHGLSRFEAGAQGEHKIKRGLLPTHCHSAHWLRDSRLEEAVAEFLPREEMAVDWEVKVLSEHTPFKRSEG